MKLEFTNMRQVIAGMKEKVARLENIPKTAKQMGVLATNEIHPLTNKKSGTWDGTIHAEVHELGKYKYELWVGSKGAFNNGYNYGARQERLHHPIEIGWTKAQQAMIDQWLKMMHGQASQTVPGGDDDFSNMSGMW